MQNYMAYFNGFIGLLFFMILKYSFDGQYLLTFGGMKSLGIAGYLPDQLHRTWCGAERPNNHLNPNVLYRVFCTGRFIFIQTS